MKRINLEGEGKLENLDKEEVQPCEVELKNEKESALGFTRVRIQKVKEGGELRERVVPWGRDEMMKVMELMRNGPRFCGRNALVADEKKAVSE